MDFGEGSSVVFSHGPLVLSTDFIVLVSQHPVETRISLVIKRMENGWQKFGPWHISFHRPLRSRDQREQAEAYHVSLALRGPATLAYKHDFTSSSTESEALFAYDSICQMSFVLQNPKWE